MAMHIPVRKSLKEGLRNDIDKSIVRTMLSLSILLLVLLSFMPVQSQTRNDLNFEFVKQVQARHEDQLFQLPGVRAVAIGQEGKQFVLQVYVNRFAGQPQLPTRLENVRVVRIDLDQDFTPAGALDGGPQHRIAYTPPVPMGVSTSNPNGCSAGTLGFRVRDPITGEVGYLTNNHIAAGSATLCPNQAPIGTSQFQPGLADNSCNPGTNIGTLKRFVTINFGFFTNNTMDAAFVVSDTTLVSNNILDIGVPTGAPRDPVLAEFLQESARTTGYTQSQVRGVNATVRIPYCSDSKIARFVGQVLVVGVTTFDAEGDSGTGLLSLSGEPVGLYFGHAGAYARCYASTPSIATARGRDFLKDSQIQLG
jgi:hypothetical protein